MGDPLEIPGFVVSALMATHATAWELDVVSGQLDVCGARGGPTGARTDLSTVLALVHPDDRAVMDRARAAVVDGHADEQRVEFRSREADGSWGWKEGWYRAAARDAHGRATRVIGVNRDISAHKRMETELSAAAERLRSYITHGSEPVWCFELSPPMALSVEPAEQVEQILAARLVDCNDAYTAWHRKPREALLGRTMADLATAPANLRTSVTRLVASGMRMTEEPYTARFADGQPRYLVARFRPVLEHDALVRLWGSIGDLTAQRAAERERESLEAQLQQARRLESVGALAGGVAHDFNNLLVAITGSVELASAEVAAGSPVARELAAIREAAQRAAELTRRLLGFARNQPARREPFSIAAVLRGLAPMLRRLLPATMALELDVPEVLPGLEGDAAAIEQAVINLVVNARDATSGIGHVRIAAAAVELDDAACRGRAGARPGPYVRITVSDDGPGIPSADLDRVFDPFYSTKPHDQGTGLGLAIVYGTVVRQHGGLVEVTSSTAGTTFALHLPVGAHPAPVSVTTGAATPTTGAGARVLVAEDDAVVRRITVALLEAAGFRVTAFEDGGTAVAAFLEAPDAFDLVMVDAIMPVLTGRQVLERVAAVRPEQRLLLVSGYAASELEGVDLSPPRRGFLAKPWTKTELLRAVRTLLDDC